mgnify:CR=1 FL=1
MKETLEEAAERYAIEDWGDEIMFENNKKHYMKIFQDGAKWQQEQYTIEEQHIEHSVDELGKEYIKGFNEGSAWQQEESYSEEDMKGMYNKSCGLIRLGLLYNQTENNSRFKELLEQFKKK